MTRKDYEKAAGIARVYVDGGDVETARTVTLAFVALFSNDNPRFDVARFRKAAGVPFVELRDPRVTP